MPDPIDPTYRESMVKLAHDLDHAFNGDLRGHDREVGFVLLTARFGEVDHGRVNYISNGEREDILAMLKELIARFEGRIDEGSEAPQ